MNHEVTDFERQVIDRSRRVPVVVDFWAAWCGPCRILGPVLERLALEAGGRWELAKVDTEAFPDLAARYEVMGIPNVKLFVDGDVVDGFVGALPERAVREWLTRAIPSPARSEVARARADIEKGEFEGAAAKLREVVESEPANGEARLALAEALLHLNPTVVPSLLEPLEASPELGERAAALTTLAHVIELGEHPERLPDDPLRDRFLSAAEALRRGDWSSALEGFIEVMRSRREWADGIAKRAARAAFVHLGLGHPVTERLHRAFSSALHV